MSASALKIQKYVALPPILGELPKTRIKPFPLNVSLPTQDDLPCCDGVPMETTDGFTD